MNKIYLKIPKLDEMYYRKQWLQDEKTMNYNKRLNIKVKGYNRKKGTITKTDEELKEWYNKWINQEPTKFFAYIYSKKTNIPVGEIYFYYVEELKVHKIGILINSKNRMNGYAKEALLELEKIAFEKYAISVLLDTIPSKRKEAIKTLEKVGFIKQNSKEKGIVDLILTKEMYNNKILK